MTFNKIFLNIYKSNLEKMIAPLIISELLERSEQEEKCTNTLTLEETINYLYRLQTQINPNEHQYNKVHHWYCMPDIPIQDRQHQQES